MQQLDGIRAKIQRVDELIKDLETDISSWLEENRRLYRTIHRADNDARQAILSIAGPPPPLRLSVAAGEIIHHLRSCFDHLIYQLVATTSGPPDAKLTRILQFPICDTAQEFERAVRRRQIEGVSSSATAEIERCQPYYHGVDVTKHPLWLLRELDNADKHRLLVVCSAAAQPHTVLLGDENEKRPPRGKKRDVEIISISPPDWPVRVTEDGTEAMRIQFGKYDPRMKVSLKFSLQVALAEFDVFSRRPATYRLQELRDWAAKFIDLFAPEFEGT
jgi:hypothetical protein